MLTAARTCPQPRIKQMPYPSSNPPAYDLAVAASESLRQTQIAQATALFSGGPQYASALQLSQFSSLAAAIASADIAHWKRVLTACNQNGVQTTGPLGILKELRASGF